MTDLLATLPSFPTRPYNHLIPSLEKHLITTTDLLTLDALEIAKRAQLPLLDVRRLAKAVAAALHADLGLHDDTTDESANKDASEQGKRARNSSLRKSGAEIISNWKIISTLDKKLDAVLGGGIPIGYITEFAGESAVGKSQFLLTISLAVQLPPHHGGLDRNTIYISTESPLSTKRLAQLLKAVKTRYPHDVSGVHQPPSMDRVLSMMCADLEVQEHIINYQVEVAIQRHNIGLVVLDSVAANYRAEFERGGGGGVGGANMARRSADLLKLGSLLGGLARRYDLAVVVANQVSDRFGAMPGSSMAMSGTPLGSSGRPRPAADISTLDHQQRWFTGWGDESEASSSILPSRFNPKTPSLGLTWTNCLAARIVLLKEPIYGDHVSAKKERESSDGEKELLRWRRWMKVVFAPWVQGGRGTEVEFVITPGGIGAIEADEKETQSREIDE